MHSPTAIEENRDQRESQDTLSAGNVLIKKKYKIDLTEHTIPPYSSMLVTVQKKQKGGYFVADVAFVSSSSSYSSYFDVTKENEEQEDIESVKESELADVIGKYPFRRFRIRGKSRIAMDIVINKDQALRRDYSNFVADVAFVSSSSSYSSYFDVTKENEEQEDIESVKESELADLKRKYKIFVEYMKTAEQKELSRKSKNTFPRINLPSVIQRVANGLKAGHMKKSMIANGAYLKKATVSAVNVKKVISDFNDLKNNSLKREIYTKVNVGRALVTTRTTIELDADIVTVIQKQPEIRNSLIINFILNVHMSNVYLSTFLLLNKINGIFSNCGMIIGFSRMTTTPFSVYNLLFISPDPLSIIGLVLPTGLFIFMPRIARLIIKYRIKKTLFIRR